MVEGPPRKRHIVGLILSNEQVAENLHLLWMDAPGVAEGARVGQFAMLRCSGGPDGWDPLLRRPMSFCRFGRDLAPPTAGVPSSAVSFLYNVVGRGTAWLAQRGRGDLLDIVGPLGNGFAVPSQARRLLCVAGGIGVAPFLALADEFSRQGTEMIVLYGAASARHLYSPPSAEGFPARVQVVLATEDGSRGHKGFVTDLVPEYATWADLVLACGPIGMFRTLARQVREVPIAAPVQALLESHMGCGLGVCWGCPVETTAGYLRVCTTGPRFDLRELVFDRDPWMAGRR